MPNQNQNSAIPHKRNDTLIFAGRAKLPSGSWVASSRLKLPESDAVVALLYVSALTPLVADPDGYTHTYVVSYPATGELLPNSTEVADQSDWPIQLVDCDVQYRRDSDGFVKSTPTFKVRVARDQA